MESKISLFKLISFVILCTLVALVLILFILFEKSKDSHNDNANFQSQIDTLKVAIASNSYDISELQNKVSVIESNRKK
jgi:anaerobic C4-dicarboxylate transporter